MAKRRSTLARRTAVEAYRFLGQIVIVVDGELPGPGFEVDIDTRPTHDGRPAFQLVRRARPGMWPAVVTPFRYGEMFELDSSPDEVELYHADGVDRVPVRADRNVPAYDDNAPGQEQVLTGTEPVVHLATGFSPALSFDEAFADALQNLPSFQPKHPDQMARVKVEEIGALFGGIAGFHQLFVKIRREIA